MQTRNKQKKRFCYQLKQSTWYKCTLSPQTEDNVFIHLNLDEILKSSYTVALNREDNGMPLLNNNNKKARDKITYAVGKYLMTHTCAYICVRHYYHYHYHEFPVEVKPCLITVNDNRIVACTMLAVI